MYSIIAIARETLEVHTFSLGTYPLSHDTVHFDGPIRLNVSQEIQLYYISPDSVPHGDIVSQSIIKMQGSIQC